MILNFFHLRDYLDDEELPLWLNIFVGVFICASIFWTILILYGFGIFVYDVLINNISNSMKSSRTQTMKESFGITENTFSIEPDGTDESSHTYTQISTRKPCENIENFANFGNFEFQDRQPQQY